MNRQRQTWLVIAIVIGFLLPVLAFLIVPRTSFRKVVPAEEPSQLRSNLNRSDAQSSVATPDDVEILKSYAENYEPKSTSERRIPLPPVLNEKCSQTLNALAADKSSVHEKYIALIFIRLYRFHLEHFQQSYDLVTVPENPLTQEFHRLMGSPRYELLLSGFADDWVRKTPELLEYPPIKKEIVRIDKARGRIDARVSR